MLSGVDVFGLSPLRRSALERVKQSEREVRFMELLTLVHAIHDVARAVNGANSNTKTKDTLSTLRDMIFPELADVDKTKKKSTEELLKREFESGSFKVQSTTYEPEKKRKNVRRLKVPKNDSSNTKQRR